MVAVPFLMLLKSYVIISLCLGLLSASLYSQPQRHLQVAQHQASMAFLDNGNIRLGVDLALGGCITYLSPSHSKENMVNLWDFGREIQMAYYSGPVPYFVGTKIPKDNWKHIGWNPIQAGDAYGNKSKVIESRVSKNEIYTKTIPLQWPLDHEPAECTFEMWIRLDGHSARVRCRLNNARSDKTFWPARGQEFPAVYTTGKYHRLISYTGDHPFTKGLLSHIINDRVESSTWTTFLATEHWAALVDDDNFGLGIYNPNQVRFIGGFAGLKREGGSFDNPTGYVAPNPLEIIDWNLVHEYEYQLVVGDLESIRKHVYKQPRSTTSPRWEFNQSREGWTYVKAQDQGWPIDDGLKVNLIEHNPQLVSPVSFWKAEANTTLVIEASAQVTSPHARVFWIGLNDKTFHADKSLAFELPTSSTTRIYRIPLSIHPTWKGAIRQIRIDPNLTPHPTPNDWIHINAIWLE